ncbi:hypothetical protein BD408DRAFT_326640, partial [Parasitella parasitica]
LELVSQAQNSDSGTTHQWSEQHDSRYGIPQDILQESVDAQAVSLPAHITPLGTLLSRPIRRQDNQTVTKIRVLASGSGRYPYGCVYHPVDDVSSSLRQPTLEPHHESPSQDLTGTTFSGNLGSSLLAQCNVVSSSPTASSDGSLAVAPTVGPDNVSENATSSASPALEALRLGIIRAKLERQNLSAQA